MNVFLRNSKILLSGLLPSLTVKDIDFEKFKNAEGLYIADPWERVKSIFTVDEYGNWHPELIYAYQMTQVGAFTGGIFGGIIQAMKETNKFLHTSDTQIFANQKQANKALSDLNILAMAKGACKWAPSFAIFCGSFALISSCCDLYCNEHRVINSIIAGFSIGVLFKVSFGIKGMISGGFIGGILGTLYGFSLWGIYKMTNTDHLQFKYAHFAYAKYKQQSKAYKKPSKSIFDDTSVIIDPYTLNISEVGENSVQKNENVEKEAMVNNAR